MSEELKTKKSKSTKGKFTQLQVIGLWVIIIGSILFWGGVAVGSYATQNSINEREATKTQAVEAYKATLKDQK